MAITQSGSKANLIQGALTSKSVATPAHYILNIRQFSSLQKINVGRYESNEFNAGGYKWKLVIYPTGNKSRTAEEFLSVYIAMAASTSLPHGWEVYATFKIFLLDQNDDYYLKVEDASPFRRIAGRRFHQLRSEWGFDQFISRREFGDSRNGYLVGDNCVFGAEVLVRKETSKPITESLLMYRNTFPYKYTWRINNYSKLNKSYETSDIFNAGGYKWKIYLYPKGRSGYISLYLALAEEPRYLSSGTKIFAEFTLSILDQLNMWNISCRDSYWFSVSQRMCGHTNFISHETFFEENRGLLTKDVCYVVADVAIHGRTSVG